MHPRRFFDFYEARFPPSSKRCFFETSSLRFSCCERLSHRALVSLPLVVSQEEETFYVVMEYMEGGDLFDHVAKRSAPLSRSLQDAL